MDLRSFGSPYFLLLTVGFTLGCVWFIRRGARLGIQRLALIDICIAAVVGGLVGSRLLHVLVEPLPHYALSQADVAQLRALAPRLDPAGKRALDEALTRPQVPAAWAFIARMPKGWARARAIAAARAHPAQVPVRLWYLARPLEVLAFWHGGLAYFGGLVLASLLCLGVALRYRAPVLDLADIAAPAVALGLIFGRIGCFTNGCCYGAVCSPAWYAIQPSWYAPAIRSVPRYPTALLSSANAAAVFLLLRALLPRRAFRGEVALALFALYAPGRFVIEAIRADPRGGADGLSTSQIAVLVTGAPAALTWAILRLRLRGRALPATAPAQEPAAAQEPATGELRADAS